ncbi:uncharacterized protein E0L32_012095 [Thyridium curvatum]|uniref:STF2-like protein n=1 Tax=Thyridium curvatum TaxID=1093900 RepID=A0A507B3D0_9PEZI|nr:uncharacterized protein E0L32_012095 [Thyridium curvatum]TPX17615.1 hypothetical protein E0L32_012095 [Thyridium curvatum]
MPNPSLFLFSPGSSIRNPASRCVVTLTLRQPKLKRPPCNTIVESKPSLRHNTLLPLKSIKTLTRSHKLNDRNHAALADGTAGPEDHIPKYFAKHGFTDADPKKIKKNGGGKANWGEPGEEAIDEGFNFANARRRSNSSSLTTDINHFKTKFEVNEPEPVFEEELHGPEDEELSKTDTSSSGSVDEDKHRA